MSLQTPYLLFLGDAPDALSAKVAQGIRDWRPGLGVGQLRLPGCKADMGLTDMTVAEAVAAGAKTLVIGVANRGGLISETWKESLRAALAAGMDVAAGLHNLLRDDPDLVAEAKEHGRTLHDVRVPNRKFPIGEGKPRAGKRILAVGTDCSCGKMYTTLALEKEMRGRGMDADFRATGQTGILITGEGIPLDAVVADFMAGAVETITPEAAPDHWDVVEGQGSIFHPSFSGVTMALIHGSRPDALILCHEPTRTHLRGLPHYRVPTLEALHEQVIPLARMVNPEARATGIAVNTTAMGEDEARSYLAGVEGAMGMPATDPYRFGVATLVDAL